MLSIVFGSICLVILIYLVWSDQERKSDITMLYRLHNDRPRPSSGPQYTISLLAQAQNEHKKQLDELRSSTTLQTRTIDEHSRSILGFDVRLDRIDETSAANEASLHSRCDELDHAIRDLQHYTEPTQNMLHHIRILHDRVTVLERGSVNPTPKKKKTSR